MYLITYVAPSKISHDLGTERRLQIHRLRATVYLLHCWCAVAVRLASGTVEKFAASAWTQGVARAGEGIAPLRAELV